MRDKPLSIFFFNFGDRICLMFLRVMLPNEYEHTREALVSSSARGLKKRTRNVRDAI